MVQHGTQGRMRAPSIIDLVAGLSDEDGLRQLTTSLDGISVALTERAQSLAEAPDFKEAAAAVLQVWQVWRACMAVASPIWQPLNLALLLQAVQQLQQKLLGRSMDDLPQQSCHTAAKDLLHAQQSLQSILQQPCWDL